MLKSTRIYFVDRVYFWYLQLKFFIYIKHACNYEYSKVFRHQAEELRARGAAIAVKRETYLHPYLTWVFKRS